MFFLLLIFHVVKCAFSRSDGGPSPAVPLPVPPNDSGVGGTSDSFGVETKQTIMTKTRPRQQQTQTCIIPVDDIHFLFIWMRWRTN